MVTDDQRTSPALHSGTGGETTGTSTAWAYVAGQPKAVAGQTHSRSISTYPTRTVPRDHLTSIANPVKRAELMELRESRVSGYDTLFHDRGCMGNQGTNQAELRGCI